MAPGSEDPAGEDLWELTVDDLLALPGGPERESQACAPAPYVVDLSVDIEPFGILGPSLADFDHLHVYQVTDWQDDRLVFRLRLGPIDSELEADMILTVVRRDYPNACSLLACDDDFRMMAIVAASAKPREPMPEATKPAVTASEPAAPPPPPPPVEEPADFAKALRDIATDILGLELAVPAPPQPRVPDPDAAPVRPPTLTAAVVARPATTAPSGAVRTKPPSRPQAAAAVPVLQLASVARSGPEAAERRAAPAEPARAASARSAATPAVGARETKPATPAAAARASKAPEPTVATAAAVARPPPPHAPAATAADAAAKSPVTAAKAAKSAPAGGVAAAPVGAASESPRVAMRRVSHEAVSTTRDESTAMAARPVAEGRSAPAHRPAAAEKAPVTLPPAAVPTASTARQPAPARAATHAPAGGAVQSAAAAADPAATPDAMAPAKAPRAAPPTSVAPPDRIAATPTARAASPPPSPLPAKSPPPRPSEPARAAAVPNAAKDAPAPRAAAAQRAQVAAPRAPSPPARDAAPAKQATAPAAPALEVLPGPPPPIDSTQTLRALVMPEASDQQADMLLAIQLATSDTEFVPDSVPNLAIFNEYRLYTAVGYQEGRVMYALRLGFFNDQAPAEAVAGYLRSYFDAPIVTRVSCEERERFGKRRVKARKDSGETGVYAAIELSSTPSAPATSLADLSARAKVSAPGMSGDTARTRGPTRG